MAVADLYTIDDFLEESRSDVWLNRKHDRMMIAENMTLSHAEFYPSVKTAL